MSRVFKSFCFGGNNSVTDGLHVLVMESEEEMVEKVERLVEPTIERSSDAEVGC